MGEEVAGDWRSTLESRLRTVSREVYGARESNLCGSGSRGLMKVGGEVTGAWRSTG